MKKLTLLFVITLIMQTELSSQCLLDGITFSTQTEIDNFQINYPGCTEIEGDVLIYGDNINNLSGLNILTKISGNLRIGIYPDNNPLLTNLSGLNNVTSIGGGLYISYNNALLSLSGLDNLTSIEGDLLIEGNYSLTNLLGLINMTHIGGDLEILGGSNLGSLSGLNNTITIGGNLKIFDVGLLSNLSGLENLISIGGDLSIIENWYLNSLTGLDNLTSIGGELWIRMNFYLSSIEAITNIDATSLDFLDISFNNHLSICDINSICDYLTNPNGGSFIYSNLSGCNSQIEIEQACTVSIPNSNNEQEYKIFPNPAKNEIFIKNITVDEIIELAIYNQLGQKVLCLNNPTNKIDISKLDQGLYFIELISHETKIRQKLILQ